MRTPVVLRRLDDATLAALRKAAGPLVRLDRWERARAPRPVRGVAARPGSVALAAALVVVAGAAVHAVRFADLEPPPASAPAPADEVGPRVGADLAAYARGRHAVLVSLAGIEEPLRAVVSFASFRAPEAVDLPASLTVERLQVWLPGATEVTELPADGDVAARVTGLVRDQRRELEREIADLEGLLDEDLGDPDFAAEFRDRLDELEAARDTLAAGEVVFAAVVVGPADVLTDLADAQQVRLVDPGGRVSATTGTRFVGVLPTDEERASVGREL